MARGIPSTFRRGAQDLAVVEGSAEVRDEIEQILGTAAGDRTQMGEVPWYASFGCRLDRLRHLPINEGTRELAFALVVEALRRWVPGIRVLDVAVTEDPDAVMKVRVVYQELAGAAGQLEISLGSS